MKFSDGFDAKRLRPRERRNWGARLVSAFAALLVIAGGLLAVAGGAGLLGRAEALGELNANPGGAGVMLGVGLLVLYLGVWSWRRSRRRRAQGLNLSPHLMKKHD